MSTHKQFLGRRGEELAIKFLKKQGYRIIEQNWRSKQWGEIDAVAVDGDCLVFVEVKTRTSEEFGLIHESVTPHKIWALKRAAEYYLLSHEEENIPSAYRLDFVGVGLDPNKKTAPLINLIRSITAE